MVRFCTVARLALLFLFLTGSYLHAATDSTSASQSPPKQSSSPSKEKTAGGKAAAARKFKDGELLVKFKHGALDRSKKALHGKLGSEKLAEFEELRLHHVRLKKGMTVEDAVKSYQADPDIEYAEPNYIFSVQALPNDTQIAQQWALKNTGQTGGTTGADIKAQDAWNLTTGSKDVVVAVLDTGIDYTHPDLAANIYSNRGYDAVNHDNDPFDDHGHGTHVAGIIGATGNNALGVAGVNWNVKMTACKCIDANGTGTAAAAISCLQWVKNLKDSGVNVVATNSSWDIPWSSYGLGEAVMAQPDVLFISAAGNHGQDLVSAWDRPNLPSLTNVINVVASDANDYRAPFSNFGRRHAMLAAPGEEILSTLPATNRYGITGGYGALSGTSSAAPFVTGVAALLKAQDPSRNGKTIKNLILSGGDSTPASYGRTITGKRLNAFGSLSCTDSPVLALMNVGIYLNGAPLNVLSINCGAPAGPVTVTTRDGNVITLRDDGVDPDRVAGDGIFSANFSQTRNDEVLRISSPAGTEVFELPHPAVVTSYLPNPTPGAPYTSTLSVQDGYAPFEWRLVSGTLPAGLALNPSTGMISGIASASGDYHFRVEVTDSYGAKAFQDLLLTVSPAGYSEAWRKISKGFVLWGSSMVNRSDVAVDRDGNVYAVAERIANPNGPLSVFKFDAAGNELWSMPLSAELIETPRALAVDPEGNLYLAGGMGSVVRYLLLKLDPQGKELWRRSRSFNFLTDVVTDASGNVYVVGDVYGYETIKYDRDGNELWARELPESNTIADPYVTVDGEGNLYLTGTRGNVVAVKYDPNGNLAWFNEYPEGRGQDLVVNSRGDVFIAGTSGSPANAFLLKLDSGGNLIWKKPFPAGKGTKGFGLALDSLDQLYMAGSVISAPNGSEDYRILKLDTEGNLLWSMTADYAGEETAERIAIGPLGEILVSGRIEKGNATSIIKYSHDVPKAALNFARQGGGSGAVRLSPGGVFANNTTRYYEQGAAVTLTAVPEVDSVFTGWGGACSGTGGCTVTMDQAQQVSASFEHKAVPLNYSRLGGGGGSVTFAPGSTCFGNCTQYFDAGAEVTLTAAATGTSIFTGWGGACSGTGSCTVAMDQLREVTASFAHGPRISYQLTGDGAGSVKLWDEPTGTYVLDDQYYCHQNCTREYGVGTRVTLTAEAYPNATFTGWGGACSGTGACTVTLTGDLVLTAGFQKTVPKASLTAGSAHTLALFGDTAWAWGSNEYGQTSLSTVWSYIPGQVTAPPFAGIFSGSSAYTSAGVGLDGSLWTWGAGWSGQMANGTGMNVYQPYRVNGLSEVMGVAQGASHVLAVLADGSLMGWGDNWAGQVGDGSGSNQPFPAPLPGSGGYVAVAAGESHSVGLKGDGTVWAWGYNGEGQAGAAIYKDTAVPSQVDGVSGVVAIAAGAYHTVALRGDGTVLTWGKNSSGQLGDGATTNRYTPQAVPGLTGITAISAGQDFTMALRNDGTVWSWGRNASGQLGIGNKTNQLLPVQVQGLSSVLSIAAGGMHAVAEKSDGTLWTWGENNAYQLGDGTFYARTTPVRVNFVDLFSWPPRPPVTKAWPGGGRYTTTQTVKLTCSKSATIYYTLDGSDPNLGSPIYTGPFTVSSTTTLKYFAVDSENADSIESVKTETYLFPLTADFSSSATTGDAPLFVSFADLSIGNPTSWLWKFGDGASDTTQHPAHTYAKAGTYTVSLTASNQGASDTATRRGYITVLSCQQAPVRIRNAFTTSFPDLLTAYAQAADNDVLELQEYNFSSDLLLDRDIRLSLKGGYDCGYQDNASAAGIFGRLTVKAGTVKLENIRLR